MRTGLLVLTLVLGWCQSAVAQGLQSCGPRADVVKRLADVYGEVPQAIGLGTNNAVVEVFASDESGSWTITVTHPNGVTCLIASGQAFETMAGLSGGKGQDT